jgi:hypothetical protein
LVLIVESRYAGFGLGFLLEIIFHNSTDISEGKTYVALAADGLLAVVLGGKGLQGGLDDTTTQAQDEVKGGLL